MAKREPLAGSCVFGETLDAWREKGSPERHCARPGCGEQRHHYHYAARQIARVGIAPHLGDPPEVIEAYDDLEDYWLDA